MSDGDDLEAGGSVGGEHTTELVGQHDLSQSGDFTGGTIFHVRPFRGGNGDFEQPKVDIVAVRAEGNLAGNGLEGIGGEVIASSNGLQSGHGVVGRGGDGIHEPPPLPGVQPGIGVLGIGGKLSRDGGAGVFGGGGAQFGPGVVGVAAGFALSTQLLFPDPTLSCGVYGKGTEGVHGRGANAGVGGDSMGGRGGVFRTVGDPTASPRVVAQAQLQLVPHDDGDLEQLPKEGQAGDLLVSRTLSGFTTLFLCVQTKGPNLVAVWAPVQLGPMRDGTS